MGGMLWETSHSHHASCLIHGAILVKAGPGPRACGTGEGEGAVIAEALTRPSPEYGRKKAEDAVALSGTDERGPNTDALTLNMYPTHTRSR